VRREPDIGDLQPVDLGCTQPGTGHEFDHERIDRIGGHWLATVGGQIATQCRTQRANLINGQGVMLEPFDLCADFLPRW
jgi:hypothetical protein